MKCIKCQKDAKYKEREGRRCPGCGATFAFEPQAGDPFTDSAFARALERVSSGDAVRFSLDHLYYELERGKAKRGVSPRGCGSVIGVVTLVPAILVALKLDVSPLVFVVLVGVCPLVAGLLAAAAATRSPRPTLTLDEVRRALARWIDVHGAPPKLMPMRALELPDPARAPRDMPKELAAYSFDRAVLCDRRETVDMLLANNFHFENNCAILSVDGYPHAVFPSVLAMLRRNPKIEVYALHDASSTGVALAPTLASHPDWFKGIGRVTDVGLSARHAKKMKGVWLFSDAAPEPRLKSLTRAERAWLGMYSVELSAVRPEQVIKRLFRAMTQPGTSVDYYGDTYYYGGDSFGGGDAGTSDGGGDSFG